MDAQHMKSLTDEEFIGVVETTYWLHHTEVAREMVRRLREGNATLLSQIEDAQGEAEEAREDSTLHFDARKALEDTLRDVERWIENIPDDIELDTAAILSKINATLQDHAI